MHRGFVKIHRKIIDNPVVFKDADHLSVWVYLLLNATHKNYQAMFNGRSTTLLPGQLITGRLSIAKKLKISDSKVKRILILFKNEQLIDQQPTNQNSLITLVSWGKYQQSDQQNDQRVTSDRPAGDQRVTTNKNVEECKTQKNVEEKRKPVADKAAPVFEIPQPLNVPDFLKAWESWQAHRKEKRQKITPTAARLQLKKLSEAGIIKAIQMINQSIANGWTGLFDVKAQPQESGSFLTRLQESEFFKDDN